MHMQSWVIVDRSMNLYFVREEGEEPSGPFPATALFAGRLPLSVDAVFTIHVENIGMATVIFSGDRYIILIYNTTFSDKVKIIKPLWFLLLFLLLLLLFKKIQ